MGAMTRLAISAVTPVRTIPPASKDDSTSSMTARLNVTGEEALWVAGSGAGAAAGVNEGGHGESDD